MSGTWNSGWVAGDVVTAAEFKKGAGAIFDTTLGAGAANIDMTSIPAGYAGLLLMLYGRGVAALAADGAYLRFNGDTGANYDFQQINGVAAVAGAAEGIGVTTGQIGGVPGNNAPANVFGSITVFIPHYANTANNKACNSISHLRQSAVSGGLVTGLFGMSWRSTAAINRLTLILGTGNFAAGTRATLYALGA